MTAPRYTTALFCDATLDESLAYGVQLMTLPELAGVLPRRGRLLGLDLGTKTIGIAMSDVERRLASPLETIHRARFTKDVERLFEISKRYDVLAFVIGLPLNMDGSEGPRAQATRSFQRNLERLSPTPTAFWDERLSTAAVERELISNNVSRAKRADVIDKMAAAYILQGALDRLNRLAVGASGSVRHYIR